MKHELEFIRDDIDKVWVITRKGLIVSKVSFDLWDLMKTDSETYSHAISMLRQNYKRHMRWLDTQPFKGMR